jgi:hypothetical protein
MAWERGYFPLGFRGLRYEEPVTPFSISEQCFIRKEHQCGKIFGASKSCFIACPNNDDLQPILALMSEKLTKVGIEPIIAVMERAYGQDIFCTKICGKIIESRFCIVILDDTIGKDQNIPNPNVYYEYGLMTSLRKHIIPLQKDDLKLAFNIQSYDTIKYNARNISLELDRAFKDAIRITETGDKKEQKDSHGALPSKTLLRKLELSGFEPKDDNWILNSAIDDTDFKGFGQHTKGFYAYIGKIDENKEFQTYLEDTGVVLYRTDKKYEEIEKKLSLLITRKKELEIREKDVVLKHRIIPYEMKQLNSEIEELQSRMALMNKIYVGYIVNPQLDSTEFAKKAEHILNQYKKYDLAISSENEIAFGDIKINFESPSS